MSLFSNNQTSVEGEIVDSVFTTLPKTPVTDFLSKLNSEMSNVLIDYIPSNPITQIFINSPLVFLILAFILLGGVAIFFDFIQDAWKLPFAILIDILDLMSAPFSIMDFSSAGGAFLIFEILCRDVDDKPRHLLAMLGAIKCILPFGIVKIIPVNTILMLIATIIDH